MKIIIVKISILLMSLTLLFSCKDDYIQYDTTLGKEVFVNINFNNINYNKIDIKTKASLGIIPESRVYNIFVYIFDANGERAYAHYFDSDELVSSKDQLFNEASNCWTVSNKTSETDATNGTIHIKAPELTNGTLYIIANIDADMVNISPDKINTITKQNQLESLIIKLNQEILSRNGYFPMSAKVENVTINGTTGFSAANTSDIPVKLVRLDSKIKFKVRVATGNTINVTQANGEIAVHTVKEFIPESWRVVNLPKTCHLFTQTTDSESDGYFNTDPVVFEEQSKESYTYSSADGDKTITGDVFSFSFYMLENRESPKNNVTDYHQRNLKNKDSNGLYDFTNGMWKNAPDNGTYVEIKGSVAMSVDVSSEAKTQELLAEVVYYIHLGDFKTSVNDYNINRNTSYDYTITIKGVNSIDQEVSSSLSGNPADVNELEPGAEGETYIAKESIITFDAHYCQRVFSFDAESINPETITWFVKTPFGREGSPNKVGDVEIPSGLDYKWVKFMVNDTLTVKDTETNTYSYSKNNKIYPGDNSPYLMDIVAFTAYMKKNKRALIAGEKNDFRAEVDSDWKAKFPTLPDKYIRKKIYVTAFIDEYYYENDPITGQVRDALWKEFVNKPNRIMHILSDTKQSLDGSSTSTGSVVSIRQRSIQTPYAINKESLKNGWGTETVDEGAESNTIYWFFTDTKSEDGKTNNYGNTSVDNGLFNTYKLLELTNGGERWDTYLDWERPNDDEYFYTKTGYHTFLHALLTRNRDNNGNGIIDPDELRWYIASTGQLYGLFLGIGGLGDEVHLYPKKLALEEGTFPSGHQYEGYDKWRRHIVSSTKFSNNSSVTEFWAEEGVSLGDYMSQWSCAPYAVRCVRNLGMGTQTVSSILDEQNVPTSLVSYKKLSSSSYIFDLSNINEKSLRYYSTRELESQSENGESSKLYRGFETGPIMPFNEEFGTCPEVNDTNKEYDALKAKLDAGQLIGTDGYRVANIREAALMSLYCGYDFWSGRRAICGTYYYLGYYGVNKDVSKFYSNVYNKNIVRRRWSIGQNSITMEMSGAYNVLTVKDINP